ncbi:MAG: hypothetical protein H6576_09710 [Lewinellaceae bacterium]|nr:hypothetical protein [Saprospiraceae bacterium]MCB9343963.1 hypothetical protein [Lewinellaceae bacterium]
MKHLLLFCGFTIFALISCKKDCVNTPQGYSSDPIRFDSLKVGQKSRYVGLTGEAYINDSHDIFSYQEDTLTLEITAEDVKGFLVTESLVYAADPSVWIKNGKDLIYQYYLNVINDTLRIIPASDIYVKSRMFQYNITKQGLPLRNVSSLLLNITGWKTSAPYCECRRFALASNYNLFGMEYPNLNVLIENSAMALDGNGETYAYSAEYGIVKASTYSWWTQDGYGWDLLTKQ